MLYLKETNTLNIPEDYNQSFCKDPMIVTDLTQVMMLQNRGVIDKTDIKILEFIYEMKFVTKQQMDVFAEHIGLEKDDINARLTVMYANTIINKFGFVEEEHYKGKLPEDIKLFYCLHTGGKQLLDAFIVDDYIDWVPGYNITSPKGVMKTLVSGELYLQFLLSSAPLTGHTRSPRYAYKDRVIKGGNDYCLTINDKPTYYISEIFFASDKSSTVKNKLMDYEAFFSNSKGWQKYYKDGGVVPTLLFITDDDSTASQLAGLINEYYRFNCPYLFSTKDRLLKGITTVGSFFYHNKEENRLMQTCLDKLV